MTFERILVAERGPMAGYIHRSLQAAGIETVAIFGKDEEAASYVDEASYAAYVSAINDPNEIIAAAQDSGSEAIHPGAGTLAENAAFVRAANLSNQAVIGPTPEKIEALSDRWTTREIAVAAGVPVIPGSAQIVNLPDLSEPLERIGLPMWVKDTWGLGAWFVDNDEELIALAHERIHSGQTIWLEAHVDRARHVVVNFLSDNDGNTVPLGVQERAVRRHGKMTIDQLPAPIEPGLAESLREATRTFADAVDFTGLGSVGFLVDPAGGAFCIGLRPRLQVGALLDGVVQGLSLPADQVRLTAGEPVGFDAEDLEPDGHALGVRIRARGRGRIEAWEMPEGVIVESSLSVGMAASGLLGVLIVQAPTRQACVVRTTAALRDMVIRGVETDIEDLTNDLTDPRFWAGDAVGRTS